MAGSRSCLARLVASALLVVVGAEAGARALEANVDTPQVVWYDEATQLKVAQMTARGPLDVVVAGTSMAWQGLTPSALGAQLGLADDEVYNAGLAGAVPVVTERWLLEVVAPELHPEMVVWGISSFDVSEVYGDANLDAYASAPASREGALPAADRFLRQYSALIRQRPALRDPSRLLGSATDQRAARFSDAAATLGPDGVRLDFTVATDADRALEVQSRISPFLVDRDDLAAIVRTVSALADQGVDVVLVELPVPPRFLALYDDRSDHDDYRAILAAAAAELDVPLLRSSETFSDADFVDFTHLDAAGAERFSLDIGAQLARLGR